MADHLGDHNTLTTVSTLVKGAPVLSLSANNGIRCLELLVMLQELGRCINTIEGKPADEDFYPRKYFSFCGATGAGAIVAVMIGVYGWSVQASLLAYKCIYQSMLPDSLNSNGAPVFKTSGILPCLAWFQEMGGKEFAGHSTPIPTSIFTRLANTHDPVVYKTYKPLPQDLSIPQILLATLAQNKNFGRLKIDGVKYQDMLGRDCHAATILEATNYFKYKEETTGLNARDQVGLLVTIGGGAVRGGYGLVTRQPVGAPIKPALGASKASLNQALRLLRGRRTAPESSDHAERKEAEAIARLEGYSYHFSLDISDRYGTPGTDYGDSRVVSSASAQYFLKPEINERVSACAQALVDLASHINPTTRL